MSISIVCDSCHSTFNVSGDLAGKKVKCRNCGSPIVVPAFEGLTSANECLSCGKPLPAGTRVCSACGFNAATGKKEATLLEIELGEAAAARQKNRRWVRPRGNPLLETLDSFFKLIVMLTLLAGLIVSAIHFFNVPGGFDATDLLPMGIVLLLVAGVMAPLAAFSINFTARQIKYAPRDDAYSRVLWCLLLPFSAAMIAGWPEGADWKWIVPLAWLAGVLLLVYFFRADVVEWIASVTVGIIAVLLGMLLVYFAALGIAMLNVPMYGDMLPSGPWTALAAGHSPVGLVTIADSTVDLGPATTASTRNAFAGPGVNPGGMPLTTNSGAGVAAGSPGTTTHAALAKLESPLLTNINAEPRMVGVRDIVASNPPGDYFLAVRDSETTTAVERWSASPLEKKDDASYPLFTKKPPQFALSPKGDMMVTLQFFPRSQIDITTFDDHTPKKTVAPSDPQATPTLLGFIDERNFCLRWDLNGTTVIEIESTAGQQIRHFNLDPINAEPAASVVSPNGKLLAAFGRGQILLYPLDANAPVRRIQASDLPVRLFALAFSPDSTEIAMYAAIDNLPTLLDYKIATGDLIYTNLLSQTAVDTSVTIIPHALLWLPATRAWLINGTDFFDPVAGKRLGILTPPPLIDVQLISSNTLGFTLRSDDTPAVTLAQPDNEQLHKK